MSDYSLNTELDGQKLSCRVVHSRRKTLQLEVLPDLSVRLIAPPGTNPAVCSRMLERRRGWLRAQRQFFRQFHPLTTRREYVSGETHLYLGRRLRLKVVAGRVKSVKVTRHHLTVCPGESTSPRLVKATLWSWYREQATDVFQERLRGCMVRLKLKPDDGPRSLVIRSYRSRWGSMSPKRTLALNIDLIRAPRECIDYVVIHELCHLKLPHHGPDFWSELETLMPDWRQRKVKLETITA